MNELSGIIEANVHGILKASVFLRKVYWNSYNHSPNSILTDLLHSVYNCGTDIEADIETDTDIYYLLHHPSFSEERLILINNIQNIDKNIEMTKIFKSKRF